MSPSIPINPETLPSSQRLDVLIIGVGLSGLAASIQLALSGHSVTIIERLSTLSTEIGAGLQLTPNATRILRSWGIYPEYFPCPPCEPKTCTVYNYKGKVLAHEDGFDKGCWRKYEAPFADCHRADLQQAMVKRAMELGVKVQLGSSIVGIDCDIGVDEAQYGIETSNGTGLKRARVQTSNNKFYTADLVVGADGLWSTCRSILLGKPDPPLPTGDLAYRIVLDIDDIQDEKIREMVRVPGLRFWIGPDSHVVAYSMRGGELYNVVLLVPDDLEEGVSRTEGDTGEMRKLFEGWDPVLTTLLSSVSKVDKWKLMHHDPLPTWLNTSSNLILIGDACHPMLPYLAQGANISIEDGAVLGLLLSPTNNSHFTIKEDLPAVLGMFEKLRKKRGEAVALETFAQRKDFHMRDGVEQEERDRVFEMWLGKEGELEGSGVEFPSRWNCPVRQERLWGYDALGAVLNEQESEV